MQYKQNIYWSSNLSEKTAAVLVKNVAVNEIRCLLDSAFE